MIRRAVVGVSSGGVCEGTVQSTGSDTEAGVDAMKKVIDEREGYEWEVMVKAIKVGTMMVEKNDNE